MSDIAWLRKWNGSPVTFVTFPDADSVTVTVNGKYLTVSRKFWRSLPLW
jgi:hypothetical protein